MLIKRGTQGKYPEALKLYGEAAEFDAENIDVMSSTGTAYSSLGEYEKAITFYDKALEIVKERSENNQMSFSERANALMRDSYEAVCSC